MDNTGITSPVTPKPAYQAIFPGRTAKQLYNAWLRQDVEMGGFHWLRAQAARRGYALTPLEASAMWHVITLDYNKPGVMLKEAA